MLQTTPSCKEWRMSVTEKKQYRFLAWSPNRFVDWLTKLCIVYYTSTTILLIPEYSFSALLYTTVVVRPTILLGHMWDPSSTIATTEQRCYASYFSQFKQGEVSEVALLMLNYLGTLWLKSHLLNLMYVERKFASIGLSIILVHWPYRNIHLYRFIPYKST